MKAATPNKPDYLFNFGYLNLDKLLRLQQKPDPLHAR